MLASENNYINEASNTMFRLSAEEDIRKRCQDREEYYREIRTYKRIIAEKESSIAEKDSLITEQSSLLAEKNSLIQQLLEKNKRLKANITNA